MKVGKIPLPGFRTIKTSIAVLACLLLYWIIGRENVLLAVFATLICVQDSIRQSVRDGISRIIGTVMGGTFGVIFTLIAGDFKNRTLLWYSIASVGIVIVIYFFNIINRNESITIGCVVFMIVMMDPKLSNPVYYATHRVIDTIIGICIAVGVNYLPLGYAHDRSIFKGSDGKMASLDYKVIKREGRKTSKWSGGETAELFISPYNAVMADRSFDWRISTATTTAPDSVFSDFSGFMRHIMVLDGNLTLVHENHHTVSLKPCEQDYFDGGWHTNAHGICKDFNLILSHAYDGKLLACENNATYFLKDVTSDNNLSSFCAIYCPSGQITVAAFCDEKLAAQIDLNEGDLLLFENLDTLGGALKFIPFTKESLVPESVCIAVYVAKK